MKATLFSVIIPTLNEEYFLPNLLSDLEKQKEKNFEVLIVDGHSQDQTHEVALTFSQNLPLRFLLADKRKVSHQRNYGASHARGTYIIFLDADSRIDPLFLQQFTQALSCKKELVFLPYLLPDRNHIHIHIVFKIANMVVRVSRLFGKPFSAGGSFFIEKKLFHNMKGFDENLYLGEDHDLIKRIHETGITLKVLSDAKIVVSLRRMDLEGQLTLLFKYIRAALYVFFNGKVTKKIFEYEMGGQGYWQKVQGPELPSYSYRRNLLWAGVLSIVLLTFFALFIMYAPFSDHTNLNKEVLASKMSDSYKKYEKILVTKLIQPMKLSIPLKDVAYPKKEINNLTTGFITA